MTTIKTIIRANQHVSKQIIVANSKFAKTSITIVGKIDLSTVRTTKKVREQVALKRLISRSCYNYK